VRLVGGVGEVDDVLLVLGQLVLVGGEVGGGAVDVGAEGGEVLVQLGDEALEEVGDLVGLGGG